MTAGVSGARSRRRSLFLFAAATGAVIALLQWLVWSLTYDDALGARAEEAEAKLAFAIGTLEKDFVRYKLLAKALSQTAALRRRATLDFSGGVDEADALLERMTAISGASDIRFLTRATALAGAERAAVERAHQGGMGLDFDPSAGGSFVIAAPVWSDARVVGAVVVRHEATALEFAWRALPETIFFTGFAGQVQLASATGLRLRTLQSADAPIPDPRAYVENGRTFWRFDDPEWRRLGLTYEEAMLLSRPVPSLSLTAFMLVDAAPARRSAILTSFAGALVIVALALLLGIILQRRAALRARLALEERAKAELELKVADRTVELTAEIDERRAVARRLRDAQEDLVRAGKLAALGRMAAGIAHEMNQPLAAIRSFADNAQILLERKREGEARANLTQIADLTDRAARIIRNLRAFARNEAETVSAVSITDAVEGALTILSPSIREANARIVWEAPSHPVHVEGGAVRLQQVIINLVTNAMDAQKDQASPEVALSLSVEASTASLSVRDYGSGLNDEVQAKLFEPFYSTKADGGEAGLGLGLAISYGIIRSFGGELIAANHEGGGAIFTIRLRCAEEPRAVA